MIVELGIAAGDVLVVRYAIVGDLDRLRIPAAGARLDPDRLWEHTCCELFVAPSPNERYEEWNFSPSGQIARFEFSAYRRRIPAASPIHTAPLEVTGQDRALRLAARVPLPAHRGEPVSLSLTAVVEDATGTRSYWALRHPADHPDFHDRRGFAVSVTSGPPIAIDQRG